MWGGKNFSKYPGEKKYFTCSEVLFLILHYFHTCPLCDQGPHTFNSLALFFQWNYLNIVVIEKFARLRSDYTCSMCIFLLQVYI